MLVEAKILKEFEKIWKCGFICLLLLAGLSLPRPSQAQSWESVVDRNRSTAARLQSLLALNAELLGQELLSLQENASGGEAAAEDLERLRAGFGPSAEVVDQLLQQLQDPPVTPQAFTLWQLLRNTIAGAVRRVVGPREIFRPWRNEVGWQLQRQIFATLLMLNRCGDPQPLRRSFSETTGWDFNLRNAIRHGNYPTAQYVLQNLQNLRFGPFSREVFNVYHSSMHVYVEGGDTLNIFLEIIHSDRTSAELKRLALEAINWSWDNVTSADWRAALEEPARIVAERPIKHTLNALPQRGANSENYLLTLAQSESILLSLAAVRTLHRLALAGVENSAAAVVALAELMANGRFLELYEQMPETYRGLQVEFAQIATRMQQQVDPAVRGMGALMVMRLQALGSSDERDKHLQRVAELEREAREPQRALPTIGVARLNAIMELQQLAADLNLDFEVRRAADASLLCLYEAGTVREVVLSLIDPNTQATELYRLSHEDWFVRQLSGDPDARVTNPDTQERIILTDNPRNTGTVLLGFLQLDSGAAMQNEATADLLALIGLRELLGRSSLVSVIHIQDVGLQEAVAWNTLVQWQYQYLDREGHIERLLRSSSLLVRAAARSLVQEAQLAFAAMDSAQGYFARATAWLNQFGSLLPHHSVEEVARSAIDLRLPLAERTAALERLSSPDFQNEPGWFLQEAATRYLEPLTALLWGLRPSSLAEWQFANALVQALRSWHRAEIDGGANNSRLFVSEPMLALLEHTQTSMERAERNPARDTIADTQDQIVRLLQECLAGSRDAPARLLSLLAQSGRSSLLVTLAEQADSPARSEVVCGLINQLWHHSSDARHQLRPHLPTLIRNETLFYNILQRPAVPTDVRSSPINLQSLLLLMQTAEDPLTPEATRVEARAQLARAETQKAWRHLLQWFLFSRSEIMAALGENRYGELARPYLRALRGNDLTLAVEACPEIEIRTLESNLAGLTEWMLTELSSWADVLSGDAPLDEAATNARLSFLAEVLHTLRSWYPYEGVRELVDYAVGPNNDPPFFEAFAYSNRLSDSFAEGDSPLYRAHRRFVIQLAQLLHTVTQFPGVDNDLATSAREHSPLPTQAAQQFVIDRTAETLGYSQSQARCYAEGLCDPLTSRLRVMEAGEPYVEQAESARLVGDFDAWLVPLFRLSQVAHDPSEEVGVRDRAAQQLRTVLSRGLPRGWLSEEATQRTTPWDESLRLIRDAQTIAGLIATNPETSDTLERIAVQYEAAAELPRKTSDLANDLLPLVLQTIEQAAAQVPRPRSAVQRLLAATRARMQRMGIERGGQGSQGGRTTRFNAILPPPQSQHSPGWESVVDSSLSLADRLHIHRRLNSTFRTQLKLLEWRYPTTGDQEALNRAKGELRVEYGPSPDVVGSLLAILRSEPTRSEEDSGWLTTIGNRLAEVRNTLMAAARGDIDRSTIFHLGRIDVAWLLRLRAFETMLLLDKCQAPRGLLESLAENLWGENLRYAYNNGNQTAVDFLLNAIEGLWRVPQFHYALINQYAVAIIPNAEGKNVLVETACHHSNPEVRTVAVVMLDRLAQAGVAESATAARALSELVGSESFPQLVAEMRSTDTAESNVKLLNEIGTRYRAVEPERVQLERIAALEETARGYERPYLSRFNALMTLHEIASDPQQPADVRARAEIAIRELSDLLLVEPLVMAQIRESGASLELLTNELWFLRELSGEPYTSFFDAETDGWESLPPGRSTAAVMGDFLGRETGAVSRNFAVAAKLFALIGLRMYLPYSEGAQTQYFRLLEDGHLKKLLRSEHMLIRMATFRLVKDAPDIFRELESPFPPREACILGSQQLIDMTEEVLAHRPPRAIEADLLAALDPNLSYGDRRFFLKRAREASIGLAEAQQRGGIDLGSPLIDHLPALLGELATLQPTTAEGWRFAEELVITLVASLSDHFSTLLEPMDLAILEPLFNLLEQTVTALNQTTDDSLRLEIHMTQETIVETILRFCDDDSSSVERLANYLSQSNRLGLMVMTIRQARNSAVLEMATEIVNRLWSQAPQTRVQLRRHFTLLVRQRLLVENVAGPSSSSAPGDSPIYLQTLRLLQCIQEDRLTPGEVRPRAAEQLAEVAASEAYENYLHYFLTRAQMQLPRLFVAGPTAADLQVVAGNRQELIDFLQVARIVGPEHGLAQPLCNLTGWLLAEFRRAGSSERNMRFTMFAEAMQTLRIWYAAYPEVAELIDAEIARAETPFAIFLDNQLRTDEAASGFLAELASLLTLVAEHSADAAAQSRAEEYLTTVEEAEIRQATAILVTYHQVLRQRHADGDLRDPTLLEDLTTLLALFFSTDRGRPLVMHYVHFLDEVGVQEPLDERLESAEAGRQIAAAYSRTALQNLLSRGAYTAQLPADSISNDRVGPAMQIIGRLTSFDRPALNALVERARSVPIRFR